MGLLSAIPFVNLVNCFCCAGVILGGVAAVHFYRSNFTLNTPPFTAGDCITVGLLAGVAGAVVGTVLSLIVNAILGDLMRDFLQNLLLNSNFDIPNDMRTKLEEAFAQNTRTAATVMIGFFFTLIVDVIFGLVGGLIGYGIFKPKIQPMPPMQKPL